MFKIYIDYDKLYDICLECNMDDSFCKILAHQQTAGIGVNKSFWDDFDENNPIYLFSLNYGISIDDESTLMDSITTETKENVLKNPMGVYILDKDGDFCNEIQNAYGVICQNKDQIQPAYLTAGKHIKLTTQTDHSWGDLFAAQYIPSNTIVINDRYLFSSRTDETIDDSYFNIEEILCNLLPNSFGGNIEYCVFIMFDKYKVHSDEGNYSTVATKLEDIRKNVEKIKRYKIRFELLSIGKDEKDKWPKDQLLRNVYNDLTVDRWILSNYYIVFPQHYTKAFHRNGATIHRQKIDFSALYHNEGSDNNDYAVYMHYDMVNDFNRIINEAKKSAHSRFVEYSINNVSSTNINNSICKLLI